MKVCLRQLHNYPFLKSSITSAAAINNRSYPTEPYTPQIPASQPLYMNFHRFFFFEPDVTAPVAELHAACVPGIHY
jgi:hypothetical protein